MKRSTLWLQLLRQKANWISGGDVIEGTKRCGCKEYSRSTADGEEDLKDRGKKGRERWTEKYIYRDHVQWRTINNNINIIISSPIKVEKNILKWVELHIYTFILIFFGGGAHSSVTALLNNFLNFQTYICQNGARSENPLLPPLLSKFFLFYY